MAFKSIYTRGERLADKGVHIAALALSLVGTSTLLYRAVQVGVGRVIAAVSIYGSCLIAMFGFSAIYNLAPSFRWNEIMRRCDHSAIYVMIAGTFTPFALVRGVSAAGVTALVLVWTTTAIGVALKLAFPRRFERTSLVLYLTLGWAAGIGGVVAGFPSPTLLLLIGGGSLYSLGVVFLLRTRLRFHNAIWHAFVLAAASCHFVAVLELSPY